MVCFRRLLGLGVIGVLAATGCHRTFSGQVTQPNPLAAPTETLRDSEKITIITGDMDLNAPRAVQRSGSVMVHQRIPLHNEASFTVVSRDRLRFHIKIEHKWSEYADVNSWRAYLIDDQGRRYVPEQVDRTDDVHVVMMWDQEIRTAARDGCGAAAWGCPYGNLVAIANDGWRRRVPLGSLSVFRGTGDLVFYHRDIFTPDVKSLTLILARQGQSFSFTWKFSDDDHPAGGPSEHLAKH